MSESYQPAPPSDALLMAAFNRGAERGRLGAKHYRDQCPFGEDRSWQRDAWLAGYDDAWRQAS